MELSLVWVLNKKTGKKQYFGVNDKHYDAMLVGGCWEIEKDYEWGWLGDINIEDDILKEEGYYYWDGDIPGEDN